MQCNKRRFPIGSVAANGFAQLLRRRRNVQNIVNDLEHQSYGKGISRNGLPLNIVRTCRHRSQLRRRVDEHSGLVAVHLAQFFSRGRLFFKSKVKLLTPHHTVCPGRTAQRTNSGGVLDGSAW